MLEFLNEIFIIIDGKEIKLYNTQDFMDTEDSVILNLLAKNSPTSKWNVGGEMNW